MIAKQFDRNPFLICPECKRQGMFKGTSFCGTRWAECIECGITFFWHVVQKALGGLRDELAVARAAEEAAKAAAD